MTCSLKCKTLTILTGWAGSACKVGQCWKGPA